MRWRRRGRFVRGVAVWVAAAWSFCPRVARMGGGRSSVGCRPHGVATCCRSAVARNGWRPVVGRLSPVCPATTRRTSCSHVSRPRARHAVRPRWITCRRSRNCSGGALRRAADRDGPRGWVGGGPNPGVSRLPLRLGAARRWTEPVGGGLGHALGRPVCARFAGRICPHRRRCVTYRRPRAGSPHCETVWGKPPSSAVQRTERSHTPGLIRLPRRPRCSAGLRAEVWEVRVLVDFPAAARGTAQSSASLRTSGRPARRRPWAAGSAGCPVCRSDRRSGRPGVRWAGPRGGSASPCRSGGRWGCRTA